MKKIILLKRIWTLCKPVHKQLLVVLILMSVQVALMSVFPIAFGHLIDGVTHQLGFQIVLGVSLWAIVAFARTILGYIREYFETNHLEYQLSNHMNQVSLKKFLDISIGEHNLGHSIVKQSVMNKGETAISGFINMFVYDVVPTAVQIIVSITLVLIYVPIIGMIALAAITVFLGFSLKYNLRFIPRFRDLDTTNNRTSKQRGEFVTHVQTVQVNAQEPRAQSESYDAYMLYTKEGRSLWSQYFNWFYGGQLFINVTQVVAIALPAYMTYKGMLSITLFVASYMWIGSVLGNMNQISNMQRNLARTIAPMLKYFAFLDYVSSIRIPEHPVKLDGFKGRIVFDNVSFTYNKRGDTVKDEVLEGGSENVLQQVAALKGISFILEAGKRYAFVGKSGSGKSTTVALILRAFDPQSGSVSIDGVNLKDVDYRELREHIGLVPQDVILFDGSLRYNVTFGLGNKAQGVTDTDLERVAEQSRIAEFAHTLEKGWDTMIGERGVKLSGGQRQRVGIARALIKNPEVLIFDEATSSLDTENEAQIRESIHQASTGKTTVIIAHRLATVKDVDTIIVFDDGNIVGMGSHDELLKQNTYYQRLVKNQMIA